MSSGVGLKASKTQDLFLLLLHLACNCLLVSKEELEISLKFQGISPLASFCVEITVFTP